MIQPGYRQPGFVYIDSAAMFHWPVTWGCFFLNTLLLIDTCIMDMLFKCSVVEGLYCLDYFCQGLCKATTDLTLCLYVGFDGHVKIFIP